MNDTARLFLALWPSPRVRAALLDYRDAWHWDSQASLVKPEQLHLTLHFIGNVARYRLEPLIKGLAVPFKPFELKFGHSDLWRHGIAVLQPQAIPASLLQLHGALGLALQGLELPVEKRESFRPHITLARHAADTVPPAKESGLRWCVRGYTLVESCREPAGRYRLVQRYG